MELTRNKNRSIQMVPWSVDTSFFYISQLIDTFETMFAVNGLKFRTLSHSFLKLNLDNQDWNSQNVCQNS